MFIRECNILNNLEDRRVFSKCYILESDKLMIGIDDILCDFIRIDCMQGLIQLYVDMEVIIFFKGNKLIVRHKLVFDFRESLETGIDPFHGSFILIYLCRFVQCIFNSFFEFRKGEKRRIHFLKSGDGCSNEEFIFDFLHLLC